jgi:hypothetical protein
VLKALQGLPRPVWEMDLLCHSLVPPRLGDPPEQNHEQIRQKAWRKTCMCHLLAAHFQWFSFNSQLGALNMALVSCTHCGRHVKSTEDTCPFCSQELPKSASVMRAPLGSRAAMLLGAGAIVIACGGSEKDGSSSSGGTSTSSGNVGSSGTPVALYGAPAPMDAGPNDAAASSSGSSSGSSGVAPAYGAPPDAGGSSSGAAPPYGSPPGDGGTSGTPAPLYGAAPP